MNGTTNDSSGNGNNCTNNGATLTTDRFGNSGKAYALNGTSSYISAFNLSPINDISVSLWFKELSAASAGFLYSSGDGNNAIFNLSLDAGGKPDYLVSRMTANSLDGISSTTPTIGTWHHIVITRTNATVAMYLDDILQTITITLNQGSLVGAISNAIPLFFGAGNSSGSPNTFLTGSLDDIRLYNRVLRTGEIDTLYHDGGWPINTAHLLPQNLTATAGNGQVTLKWNKNSESDFLKYRIYRGTTSGGETLVDSSTASIIDTTKTLTGLTAGTTYYFKVTAIDSVRLESVYSNEASATPFGPPTIASFSPTSGPIGTTVTITGTRFNSTANKNIIYFGGVKASTLSATLTTLTVNLPQEASYAQVSVTDTSTNLTAISTGYFSPTFVTSHIIDYASFALNTDLTVVGPATNTLIVDLDGDGKSDVVETNNSSGSMSVLRNLSTTGSISFSPKQDFPTGTGTNGADYGDLDGDGKPDIVVANFNAGYISVFRNTSVAGAISFASRIVFSRLWLLP